MPRKKLTENAVRRRARLRGMLLRKAPCGGYHVLKAETGKPFFRPGFNHPRSLCEIAEMLTVLQRLIVMSGRT